MSGVTHLLAKGEPGVAFSLETSEELSDEQWLNVGQKIIPNTKTSLEITINSDRRESQFYRAIRNDWQLTQIPNRFLHFSSLLGTLKSDQNPTGDNDTVTSWLDLSDFNNNIFALSADTGMQYFSAGGPIGQPVVTSLDKLLRRNSLNNGSVDDFTLVFMGRWRSGNFSVADRIWAGDNSPTLDWRGNGLNSATITTRIPTNSSSSGNMNIPADEWFLYLAECRAGGGGRWSTDDNQLVRMSGTLTDFSLDAFALGGTFTGNARSNIDILEIVFIEGGVIEEETHKQILNYAGPRLGKSFSNTSRYEDLFDRQDTADNKIGKSLQTHHGYKIIGSGGSNTRILNSGLTNIDPWGTFYAFPNVNFSPSVIGWEYTSREGPGGSGLNSTNAVGLTKRLGDLSDMIHFVWGYRGWRLERFINGNGIIVAQRQSGSFNYPSGSYELSFNFASGKVYVKDPEGILTECDWNNTQDAGLLSDYNTNSFFYEIISSGDDELITTYSRCYARD